MSRRMLVISAVLTMGFLLPIQDFLSDSLFAATKGEVYRRVDRNGFVSFTNVPTNETFTKVDLGALRLRSRLPMKDLEGTIAHHSRQHQLDPALISAIIKAESDFDPDAISRAGAIGLMQLMPQTAVRLEVRDPFNPEENIAGGARYLRYLLDRFHGNLPLALAAYNAGATRVEQYNTLPPIHETRRYVKKVLRFYRQYDERRISHPSSIRPFSAPTWPRTVTVSSFQNP
jgi:soluble lytic murein transglycosylase-like protein